LARRSTTSPQLLTTSTNPSKIILVQRTGQRDRGFDCSGLTKAAHSAAGLELPRKAQTQYNAGPRISVDQLQAGDLVFFASGAGHITHVGLVLSSGSMINAPDFGTPVRVDAIRKVFGATRPAGA
jgi:cell wall-associated NlpC family hydrolase